MDITKTLQKNRHTTAKNLAKLKQLGTATVDPAILQEVSLHRYQTPYVLTDLSIVGRQYARFRQLLPEIKLFYALKSNDNPAIVNYLKAKVDGYDAASIGEIRSLVARGIKPTQILFSNPVKSRSAIQHAYKIGVKDFVFQSQDEIVKLSRYAPNTAVYLRLMTETNKKAFTFAVSNEKFGAPVEEAVQLLEAAKQHGLKPVGLAFHVGSQMSDPKSWANALGVCFETMKRLAKQGIKIKTVDIGGGYPINYGPLQPGCNFDVIAKHIREKLRECPYPNVKFVAEPGRFLVAESTYVVTSVVGNELRNHKKWLFVDVSVFHTFMEKFGFNSFPFPIHSLEKLRENRHYDALQICAVTGPTCDSFDTMNTNVLLPAAIKTGDRLLIGCAGAYSLVYASHFNGFKIPLVHFFESQPHLRIVEEQL